MEDALAQKYDQIQQFATRDWLGPSSASLARLERVKANVHNITPTLSQNLRPISASRSHKIYTELDTAPPLASKSLHSTASAWGSDASIPELIKQQGERQIQRQASAQGPRRPWSGRKVPPSPIQRRPTSETDVGQVENESQRRLNAFMSVKGAKYNPKSRPPSGRGSGQTTGTALAELMVGLEELSEQDVESMLEEFIRNQPSPGRHELVRLSAMYGDHPSLVAPPPAPHGSPIPDQNMLHDNDDEDAIGAGNANRESDDAHSQFMRYKEIKVNQPAAPQLLRRPTPEPVRLTMTIPGVGDDTSEPDDDFVYSDRSQEGSPDAKPPTDLELQSVTSEVLSQLDDSPDSPSWHPYRDQPTPLSADNQVRVVTKDRQDENVAKDAVNLETGLKKDLGTKLRSKHSVHIMEEHNVTIDITPRDILKPYVPRPPVGKRRPQSAVTASRSQNDPEMTTANTPGSRVQTSPIANRAAGRPKSARPRVAKMPTVGIEYGDDSQNTEVPGSRSESLPLSKTRSEVETMMSHMALSDEETDDCRPSSVARRVSQSSFKRNYYELSREASVPTPAALLTTKTIQFGDHGPFEEKSVSIIKQVAEPFRSALLRQDRRKEVVDGRRRRAGSVSDDDAAHRTHSAIRRPTKLANTVGTSSAPPRPESRMGHRQGDTDTSTTLGETEAVEVSEAGTDAKPSLTSSRPVSAPSKRQSAETATGRRSPGRSGRRPHSAKPPTGSDDTDSKLGSKSNTAIAVSLKKRSVEYKRNCEAVKALRDGTLHKEKRYTKQFVAVNDPKAIIPRPSEPASELSQEPPPQVVPLSAQEQEMEDIHQRLLERGVNISAQTLARGLLPPTQRGYDDCTAKLPDKSSLGLLNQPEAWLGKLFQKYKLAEKALAIANERMVIQAGVEAKQRANGPDKKKKKVGKRKDKHKRSNTVT